MKKFQELFLFWSMFLILFLGCHSTDQTTDTNAGRGSRELPLRVMLVPSDGGTEDGTRADFEPIFQAITQSYGLHFDIRVGQSYSAVVQGMIGEKVDIAFFGAVTFQQARKAGAAELLAVAELNGKSVYYSGIFIHSDSMLQDVSDLKGKSIAFGDINSSSSFNYPVAMLLSAGLDPIQDLQNVFMTGTHANSLQALASKKVDAASAAFDSFEKAVANGKLDPQSIRPLARSEPIPYPPLAMHTNLEGEVKSRLRDAFRSVHEAGSVKPEQIRGYGGKRVDRYNVDFSVEEFDLATQKLSKVTKELKEEILRKASNRAR